MSRSDKTLGSLLKSEGIKKKALRSKTGRPQGRPARHTAETLEVTRTARSPDTFRSAPSAAHCDPLGVDSNAASARRSRTDGYRSGQVADVACAVADLFSLAKCDRNVDRIFTAFRGKKPRIRKGDLIVTRGDHERMHAPRPAFFPTVDRNRWHKEPVNECQPRVVDLHLNG